MNSKKLFVSYALEEKEYLEDFLKQAQKEKITYELIYLSEKEPLSEEWRDKCKNEISKCDAVVFLISPYLKISEGAFWEMKYAKESTKSMIGVFVGAATIRDKPMDLWGVPAMVMSWERLTDFVLKANPVKA
ncbi:MAG TPA: TIR domain-containing protein [Lentimicrobium sp.]|nr:TIR domain-containing protein [Lentimicrobium sp.]